MSIINLSKPRYSSSVPRARNFQWSVKIASLCARREKAARRMRSEEIGDEDLDDDAISIRTSTFAGTEKAIRAELTMFCDSFDIFLANLRLRVPTFPLLRTNNDARRSPNPFGHCP